MRNNGKLFHYKGLLLVFHQYDSLMVGFSVSKKCGNAVTRNKIRRIMIAISVELIDHFKNGLFLFIGRPYWINNKFFYIKNDFLHCIKLIKSSEVYT